MRAPDSTSACRGCGHARQAHEHYRRGSDCSLCDCAAYRGTGLLTRLLQRRR